MKIYSHAVRIVSLLLMMNGIHGAKEDLNEPVLATCGVETETNNTLFLNPDFPSATSNGGICDISVLRSENENICQVKLELNTFILSSPDPLTGICHDDYMTIIGSNLKVPLICGLNTGQHIYVDVDPLESHLMRIVMDGATSSTSERTFDIKIIKIPCDSPSQAPSGCLQYHQTTSGTVKSFNFPTQPIYSCNEGETAQLSNTEYSVCVREEFGYCSISWTPDPNVEPYSFFLTGSGSLDCYTVIGNPQASDHGDSCEEDYVLIPGGVFLNYTGKEISRDRFCGAAFPSYVDSSFKPFQMYVKSDSSEYYSEGNFGFSLNFRQNACTSQQKKS